MALVENSHSPFSPSLTSDVQKCETPMFLLCCFLFVLRVWLLVCCFLFRSFEHSEIHTLAFSQR